MTHNNKFYSQYSESLKRKKIIDINSMLCILYFFQFGLLLPLSKFVGLQSIILIFTVLIIIVLVKNNWGEKINLSMFFLIIIPILIIGIKYFLYPNNNENAIQILMYFVTIGISGIVIGSYPISLEKFLDFGYKIGVLNFFLLFLDPFFGFYEINYMRFGYALLPSVLFIFVKVYKNKRMRGKILPLIFFLISLFEIFLFGARGCFIATMFFVAIYLMIVDKKHYLLKGLLISLGFVMWIYLYQVLIFIANLISSLGFSSYSISKYIRAFEEGIAGTSSGRAELYALAIENIKESPLIGNQFTSSNSESSFEYYHNIFLQIGSEFGVVVLAFFAVFILFSLIKSLLFSNLNKKIVYMIMFSVVFGRLMFSSDYWQRPEFWLFMGIYFRGTLASRVDVRNNKNEINVM
ncbi:hypothetical protein J2X61_000082 [Bacillus sp. 3255]|nr:hypothetical protein [Bacillus sp. 3255]